jgi:polyhydroxybutyrate depolymerase
MRLWTLWLVLGWTVALGIACEPNQNPMAGANTCRAPLAAGSDNDCRVTIGGVQRAFFVHVPRSFAGQPLPLVVDLHGTGSSRQSQRSISGWIAVADREGLIVVHPQALSGRTGRTQWNAGDCCEEGQTADDEAFLREAVRITQGAVQVDPARVFATGLSTGGVMSHFLGCRAADVFKGIAPISFQLSSRLTCTPVRSVGMIEFHAPTDRQRPFNGHNVRRPDGSITPFPSAPASAARWAAIDRCSTASQPVLRRGGSSCAEFPGCADARVQFCSVDGAGQSLGGHVLYTNNDALDLAQLAWDFFESLD